MTLVQIFPPSLPSTQYSPIPSSNPSVSSCPWLMHISSLATLFPVLFLTSPCLFCTYQCVLLNLCIFSPIFPFPPSIPPLSLCPWVIHINSLASPSPILFLTSPSLFCTYQLYFLIPAPFPPFSPLLPT